MPRSAPSKTHAKTMRLVERALTAAGAQRNPPLLLERDLEAFRGDLDVGALGFALEVDDHALVVAKGGDSSALAGRALGSRGRVDAVDVIQILQVVNAAGCLRLGNAHLGYRESRDLELVRLAGIHQLAASPAPPDPGGDRSLVDPDRGVRLLLIGPDSDTGRENRQDEGGYD